ncbi:MAG: 3-hydroxyacyl-CoA dehydrogenase [Rhodothermales bacterium]|jgi:3-hydroxyacyl-CoA dehydrogenase
MYKINKAAVIGAGTMGLGIAGQLANADIDVILLDVPSKGENRNAVAQRALERLLDVNQPGLLHKDKLQRITIGNIEDDMHRLSDVDWIAEAVVERLDIKRALYRQIDDVRKHGSIVSSNTSTIPISLLVADMPESFKQEFAITHFFNPVRFMRLLELVRGQDTLPEVIDCLEAFCEQQLGKGIVVCNDTPGFLGNRVGVFAIQTALHSAFNLGLKPEEADALFGRPMGVPKTGVFGLYDLIGIDLMSDVAKSLVSILPADDPFHSVSAEIPIMTRMIEQGLTGNKSEKGGFYRFENPQQSTSRQTLDFNTFSYRDSMTEKPAVALKAELAGDFTLLLDDDSKFGQYCWEILSNTLSYAACLIPNVTVSLVAVDDAMKLGYNWLKGPFEMLDAMGVDWFIARMNAENREVPEFIKLASGRSFYRVHAQGLQFLDADGIYQNLKRSPGIRRFSEERRTLTPVLENRAASYFDLGDQIGIVEFHSKANALDSDSMHLLASAVEHASQNFKGLVIHNDAAHFSCGVNLGAVLEFITDQNWQGLENFLSHFQQTVLAMRNAPIPVVAAPSGLSLGGGFEVVLHCDKVIFHANSVAGLVESLVGVVPGGGGVKETLYRWTEKKGPGTDAAWEAFMQVGYGKTAGSPLEGRELTMFRDGIDAFVMNRDRLLDKAVEAVHEIGRCKTRPKRDPLAMAGREVWAKMQDWLQKTHEKGYLTPHDVTTGAQIAMIVTGGDVDQGTMMSETDIMGLERNAFLTLAKTEETKARISHMLEFGSPLRN